MNLEPQLHLHFHQEKDCRKCWPSFFGCCHKAPLDPDADEFAVTKRGTVKGIYDKCLDCDRRRQEQVSLMLLLKEKTKCPSMQFSEFVKKINELSGLNLFDKARNQEPITYHQLVLISQALNEIKDQGKFKDDKLEII